MVFAQAAPSSADNSIEKSSTSLRDAIILESTADNNIQNEQVTYWQTIVDYNRQDQQAWMNLFKSTMFVLYPERSRNLNQESFARLHKLLDEMKSVNPNGYAYHYCNYLLQGKNEEGLMSLSTAYAINQQNEFIDDMLAKAIIENNSSEIQRFSSLLKQTGIYGSATFEYNQNVLASLEKNAVLITYGSADTYPLVVLQQEMNQRKDVQIINLEWLTHPQYSVEKYELLKVKAPEKKDIPEESHLKELLKTTSEFPIYLGLTLSEASYAPYKNKLYCTGLAFKYSEVGVFNIEVLEKNWKNFKKKYILSGEALSKNYQLPLAVLSKWSVNEKIKQETKQVLEQLGVVFPNNTIQKYR